MDYAKLLQAVEQFKEAILIMQQGSGKETVAADKAPDILTGLQSKFMGNQVRITSQAQCKGATYPTGTTGTCFWVGKAPFGYSIGMRLIDKAEPVFVDVTKIVLDS